MLYITNIKLCKAISFYKQIKTVIYELNDRATFIYIGRALTVRNEKEFREHTTSLTISRLYSALKFFLDVAEHILSCSHYSNLLMCPAN